MKDYEYYVDGLVVLGVLIVSAVLSIYSRAVFVEEIVAICSSLYGLMFLKGLSKKIGDTRSLLMRKLPHVVGGIIIVLFLVLSKMPLAVALTESASIGFVFLILTKHYNHDGALLQGAQALGLAGPPDAPPRFLITPFYAFIAFTLLYMAASREAAVAGILCLALGDSAAAWVGVHGRIGIPKTGGKTVEGSLAMFTTNFVTVFAVSYSPSKALAVAGASTVIEALNIPPDDNFLIPLVSAAVFMLV